jgi:hypothetical protein
MRRFLVVVLMVGTAGLGGVKFAAQEPTAKSPVPGKEALAEAEAEIRSVFKTELAKVKDDPKAGKELANELLKQARKTTDSLALRFAGLALARDLAARAGDHATALDAIDELAASFQVNTSGMKAKVFVLAARETTDKDVAVDLIEAMLEMLPEALAADDYQAAAQLLGAAQTAMAHAKSLPLAARIEKAEQEVHAVQKQFEQVKPFVEKLKDNAADAEANGEVGKYYSLYKGNWERGLPLLARGKDDTLKALAVKDLAKPRASKKQAELGDGWWDLAQKEKPPAQTHLQERAAYWYELALPDLTGLARVRIQKRLDGLEARDQPSAAAGPIGNVPVGEIRRFVGHTGGSQRAVFSRDGRRILSSGADNTLRLWDTNTGKELRVFTGHTSTVIGVSLSGDGKTAVSGGYDETIRLWDVNSGKQLHQVRGHDKGVWCVTFAPDGRTFASSGSDNVLKLWDTRTAKEIRQFKGHTGGSPAIVFSADGKKLVSASHDRTARLWDVATGKELRKFVGHTDILHGVDITRDGRWIITSGGVDIKSPDTFPRLWDALSGKEVRKFAGHTGFVYSVIFSPDGRRAISSGRDSTVRLWDVKSGKELHKFSAPSNNMGHAVFAPHGRYALSTHDDGALRLWGLPR